MKKKGLTHLIATDRANVQHAIWKGNISGQLHLNPKWVDDSITPQHIYITTDEEIKEGDEGKYVIGTYSNFVTLDRIKKVHNLGKTSILLESSVDVTPNILQIIVATDNPELWEKGEYKESELHNGWEYRVAKIPLSFLKEYVEKQPKEVMLEYECTHADRAPNGWDCGLKLNSSGGVIISPVEERMYTRTEVKEMFKERFFELEFTEIEAEKWFNKNYPI